MNEPLENGSFLATIYENGSFLNSTDYGTLLTGFFHEGYKGLVLVQGGADELLPLLQQEPSILRSNV